VADKPSEQADLLHSFAFGFVETHLKGMALRTGNSKLSWKYAGSEGHESNGFGSISNSFTFFSPISTTLV
jgi:hypothetical protein